MQDFLSSLLSSIIYGEITSKTKKEEHFLNKKKTRETVKKYQLPAGIIAYSFSLLLLLLIAAAIFQSKGQPITALFQGSLYVLTLTEGTALFIRLLCRCRKSWNEQDFYLSVAVCGNMPPRRLKQLKFLLIITACSGLACSAFLFLATLI